MGQRHQLYIIAKTPHKGSTEARYKCVAAFHHQWLYGRTALAACKAFLTLVRNKDNAKLVEIELASIASTYQVGEKIPPNAAPFLSWMLHMAITLRSEEHYYSTGVALDPPVGLVGSQWEDNNDGITVFDVTDPASPAYCFVSIGSLRSHDVEDDIPLTAESYVRAYYPLSSERTHEGSEEEGSEEEGSEEEARALESDVQKHIDNFKDEVLIETSVLEEAWSEKVDTPGANSGNGVVTGPTSTPALSEVALHKAMAHIEESGLGDATGLATVLLLPGAGPSILKILAKLDGLSKKHLTILLKVLPDSPDREAGILDISPYVLTLEQVTEVVSHFPLIEALNLNGNHQIDGATLLHILPTLPNIHNLIIYDCPKITLEDIAAIRSAIPRLHAIYHRSLMMHREASPPHFTFAFKGTAFGGMAAFFRSGMKDMMGCSHPSLSPRAIVVALCDFYDFLEWERYSFNSLLTKMFFSSLPRAPQVSFKERALGNVPDNATLAPEGWLYALKVSVEGDPPKSYGTYVGSWGFIKYKFSNSSGEEQGGKRSLDTVEVMDLARWLEVVDIRQEVEKEWVERLESALAPSRSLKAGPHDHFFHEIKEGSETLVKMVVMTQEEAIEVLTEQIPLFSDSSSRSASPV